MIINYSDQEVIKGKKSIFLAGPTPRGGNVVYGRPNDASKIKYLDWLYRLDYDKIPYENLQSLLEASVELASNLYDE